MKRRLIGDGVWVAFAHAAAAIGALATVRVLTEVLAPEDFGVLSLSLGAVTLALGLFCTPILQAYLRYFPDFDMQGRLGALRVTTKRILFRRAGWLLVSFVSAGALVPYVFPTTITTVALLGAFLSVEVWRSYQINLFNPARRQRAFALVTLLESTLRPIFPWLAAVTFGYKIESILLGYVLVSFTSAASAWWVGERHERPLGAMQDDSSVERLLTKFSVPLMPLTLVGWVNGTIDRYVVAIMLGNGAAGIYAAAYGLVSRPFLAVGHVAEQTLRPVYYEAVSHGQSRLAQRTLQWWLGSVTFASVIGLGLVLVLADGITRALLGPQFGGAASVLPWIAVAYVPLVITQAMEKKLYAQYKTDRVFLIEGAGSAILIVLLPFLVGNWGIVGAAASLLMATMAQLATVIYVAHDRNQPNQKTRGGG